MAARAKSVHSPLLSRIDGTRSATIDVQKDGHAVDVDVGQLKVEVAELELEIEIEIDVEDGEVVLGDVLPLELEAEDAVDEDGVVLEADVDADVEIEEGTIVDAEAVVLEAELTDADADDELD